MVLVTMVKSKTDFSNTGLSPSSCEMWFSLPLATWCPETLDNRRVYQESVLPTSAPQLRYQLRHKPGPQILVCRCWDGRVTRGEVSSVILVTCPGQWLMMLSSPGTLSLQSSSGSLLTISDITFCCSCLPPV